MASNASELIHTPLDPAVTTNVKLVVAGRFGVGKTTFISAISEITPLSTEETLTDYSTGVDESATPGEKTTTTVAMDFGRRTIDNVVIYMFGAPGQPRFHRFLDNLMTGALGGVILADTGDLQGAFAGIDLFERHRVPYIVAINTFPQTPHYPESELRQALAIASATPLVFCDAREADSVRAALIALIRHLIHRSRGES